ncbi:MAG: hypothetical protein WCP55_23435, partial [Lentisphaerota bacterium]
MIYNAYRVLCFFCLVFPFVFCLSAYGLQTSLTSATRIEKINDIISKYKDQDLKDTDVVKTIMKDVSEL